MFAKPIRFFFCLALLTSAWSGCSTPSKSKDVEKKLDAKALEEHRKKPKIPDQSADTTFIAFVGRLRIAVAKRDRAILKSMMTADFGYRWDPAMENETPFDYWEEHKLWSDLERMLHERFVPSGDYMVAPPEFVTTTNYTGYRVGLRLVNGGWRFAYFISGQDVLP